MRKKVFSHYLYSIKFGNAYTKSNNHIHADNGPFHFQESYISKIETSS